MLNRAPRNVREFEGYLKQKLIAEGHRDIDYIAHFEEVKKPGSKRSRAFADGPLTLSVRYMSRKNQEKTVETTFLRDGSEDFVVARS